MVGDNSTMDEKAEGQKRSIMMTQNTSYLYIQGPGGDTGTFKLVFCQLAGGQDEAVLSGLDRYQDQEGGLLHVGRLHCAWRWERLVARKCAMDLRKSVFQLRVLFWVG